MDGNIKQTQIRADNTRSSVSIHRDTKIPRSFKSYNHTKSDRSNKRHRHNLNFLTIGVLCLTQFVHVQHATAETVGGVSATASPIANSSGSVTNQAIQVLQGPYITNTYGSGIQCQGPTLNVTPYITGTASAQKPYEDYWDSPVYDMSDLNEDGVLDNPGDVLYYVPTRTGQKDNYNYSVGVSATWSKPLDKKLQQQCKEAAAANIALMNQTVANKRLDFEIARLKNCGNLIKEGISFHPKSPYYSICADVVVQNVNNIAPHAHTIPKKDVLIPNGGADTLKELSIGH